MNNSNHIKSLSKKKKKNICECCFIQNYNEKRLICLSYVIFYNNTMRCTVVHQMRKYIDGVKAKRQIP